MKSKGSHFPSRFIGRKMAHYCCPRILGSYQREKNVLILSTLESILGTAKNDNCQKLGLYKLNDFTKSGTDIVDQCMGFHTTKTKSRKWTLVIFAYMLDTARANSLTIYALNQGKDPINEKSCKYTYHL